MRNYLFRSKTALGPGTAGPFSDRCPVKEIDAAPPAGRVDGRMSTIRPFNLSG